MALELGCHEYMEEVRASGVTRHAKCVYNNIANMRYPREKCGKKEGRKEERGGPISLSVHAENRMRNENEQEESTEATEERSN